MDEPASSSPSSLRALVQEIFLAAVGAVVVTRERAETLVDDLARRGRLSNEESRKVAAKIVAGSAPDGHRLTDHASTAFAGVVRELGLVRDHDVAELELRIAQLEHRLRLLEQKAAERPGE
jgi:polyhydroxyalkanoate synthesis regulator phasin